MRTWPDDKGGRCPRQRYCLVKDLETKQEQHVETGAALNGGSDVAGERGGRSPSAGTYGQDRKFGLCPMMASLVLRELAA